MQGSEKVYQDRFRREGALLADAGSKFSCSGRKPAVSVAPRRWVCSAGVLGPAVQSGMCNALR